MNSRTIEREGLQVQINNRNQLEVDMSIDQMNAIFTKLRGRVPANRSEAESFVMQLVYKKLAERGLISNK